MCEWNWEWKLRVGLNFLNFVCGFITTLQGNKITNHAFFSHEASTSKAPIDLVAQCVDLDLKLN
jgi:hypothetical protein